MARTRPRLVQEGLLARRRRHDLAVGQHPLGGQDGRKLGLLAHDREADSTAGSERRGEQKQRERARDQAQIEVWPLGDANAGEDQRPNADEHDHVARLGEAVVGDAGINRDEQEQHRQRRSQTQ